MIDILIVEDDLSKAKNIVTFLDSLGINGPAISSADNVAVALGFLRGKKYNILILDLNIPLRKNSDAVENGGSKILYALTSNSYIAPDYVIGLTQFEEYQKSYTFDFNKFDFNIYNFYDDSWKEVLTRKIEWVKKTSSSTNCRKTNKKIIVCTHGIMTMGSWPKKINQIFSPLGYEVVRYDYPHYSALKIIFPWSRRKILNHYSKFIRDTFDFNPNCELNFISHSFGTYLLMRSLENINVSYRPMVNGIILCGSVLKSNYDIEPIIKKFEPNKIINDCAYNDTALLCCNILCTGLGNGGRIGLYGYNERFINRYVKGDHSIFFNSDKILQSWKSTIVDKETLIIDERNFSTSRENLESLINVISPLLVPITFVIFLFLTFR